MLHFIPDNNNTIILYNLAQLLYNLAQSVQAAIAMVSFTRKFEMGACML